MSVMTFGHQGWLRMILIKGTHGGIQEGVNIGQVILSTPVNVSLACPQTLKRKLTRCLALPNEKMQDFHYFFSYFGGKQWII